MKPSSSVRGPLCHSIVFLFVLSVSCSLIDPPLQFGSPRAEDRSRPCPVLDSLLSCGGRDTLLLVSAVSFPDSYDWQKDSAYGGVSCVVHLFSGAREVLAVPAGPGTTVSAAPDGHHIIGGSLYTIYCDAGGTCVGCNGRTVARWEGSERIIGLVPRSGTVYTLGETPSGGLSYRCGGRELLGVPSARAFGRFGADTYGPTGALYECDSQICFAFCVPDGGGGKVHFVRDGETGGAVRIPDGKLLDAKCMPSGDVILYDIRGNSCLYSDGVHDLLSQYMGVRWTDAGIVEYDGRTCVAGRCITWFDNGRGTGIGVGHRYVPIEGNPDYLYFSGGQCLPVSLSDCRDCYFFGAECACPLDGEAALALTPKDPAKHPFSIYRGSVTEYPVYGFLSGISFQIP